MKYWLALSLLLVSFTSSIMSAQESFKRIHFEEIDSTQIYAKSHADVLLDAPGQWIVITADLQTNGLGFQGRKWISSFPENLYVTFATLYPKNKEDDLFHVNLVSALAVSKTLLEFNLNSGIKWINDVLVDNKKISGSLCEIMSSKFEDYYILLMGIGVNVNMTHEDSFKIPTSATSIRIETGNEVDKELVLMSLFNQIKKAVGGILERGSSTSYWEIDQILLYKGKVIDLEIKPNVIVQGKMIGIDADGSLMLETEQQGVLKTMRGRILRVYQ